MSTVKIASIYFAPVTCGELQAFGFGTFSMPAVPFGEAPFILSVTDKVQHDKGPFNGGRQRQSVSYQHSGESIAASLLNHWSALGMGMTPQCRPGMWMVREKLPLMTIERRLESGQVMPSTQEVDGEGKGLWRDATDEEKKVMWDEDLAAAQAAQFAYAEYLFMQANIMAERPAMVQFIQAPTRLAAAYYRRTFDWMKPGAATEQQITCQWCQARIPPKSIICQACDKVVDPKRYAELKKQTEAEIEEATTAPDVPKIPVPRSKGAMGLQPVGA